MHATALSGLGTSTALSNCCLPFWQTQPTCRLCCCYPRLAPCLAPTGLWTPLLICPGNTPPPPPLPFLSTPYKLLCSCQPCLFDVAPSPLPCPCSFPRPAFFYPLWLVPLVLLLPAWCMQLFATTLVEVVGNKQCSRVYIWFSIVCWG